MTSISDFSRIQLLEPLSETTYKITILNNDVWKINVPDLDSYRMLAHKLNTEKVQWYTYENKNERPIRVVARGLHITCAKEDLIEDPYKEGYKILDATNIIKKEKQENQQREQINIRRGLPLFILTFNNKESLEKMYGIRTILIVHSGQN